MRCRLSSSSRASARSTVEAVRSSSKGLISRASPISAAAPANSLNTKGIPERLRAYALLLRSSSDFREKVVLIQIAVPTREGIDTYQDLRTEVNRLVGEINGKLGTPNWTPASISTAQSSEPN